MTTALRFWAKVDRGYGCWTWCGAKNPHGYGKLNVKGRTISAHRFAYEHTFGPIENRYVFVCHSCDNPSCVRPDHLFLGSRRENMADMVKKGRWNIHGPRQMRKGENHPHARLSDDQIRQMKQLRSTGASYAAIGTRFGASTSATYQSLKGIRRAV